MRCFLYHKVTKLKANHNRNSLKSLCRGAVSYITKLLNWKQITTQGSYKSRQWCCFLYHKVTKLKANHNMLLIFFLRLPGCFLYHKVTKLKANHNTHTRVCVCVCAVSYITKLLNWKQITTKTYQSDIFNSCFLYHKVTKLKANHN